MKEENRNRFVLSMEKLRVTFPIHLTPEEEALRMEVYWQALDGFPIDYVEGAVNRSLKENQFFPKPIELKAIILDEMDQNWQADQRDRWPEIEYREPMISRERAIEICREIEMRLEQESKDLPILEGEAAEKFERKRNAARSIAKRYMS